MDSLILVVGAVIAVLGLLGIAVAAFHRSPGNTRIIRVLAWPGIKPTDRIALPLSATLTCAGLLLSLNAWHRAPTALWLVIAAIGVASAVTLGLRRSEG